MLLDGSRIKVILAGSLMVVAYVAIPCLGVLAYLGWAKRWRSELPIWRSYLGVGSSLMTLVVWLESAYLAYRISAHLRTDFFTVGWTVANILVALTGAAGSLALKGRPRVYAFLAACLMATPWIISYLGG